MIEQPEYFRYLESAKKAEMAERLRAEGYTVETEKLFKDVRFDLVASKGEQGIAYEFKSGNSPQINRESLEHLHLVAREAGLEFRIVVVNPPPRVNVEVDDLSSELLAHLIDNFPDALDTLSTHTEIDNVTGLDISDLRVRHGDILVEGRGSVDVTLRYGGGSDDGPVSGDAFPFHFKAVLTPEGRLNRVEELTVETNSFYE